MKRVICACHAMHRLIALAAFMCMWAPANAAVNDWTQIGPAGGFIRGLAFHPTAAGVMYSTAEERVYISTDNGMSWTPRPKVFSDVLSALAVDPTNGDVLYVFDLNYGLWRSADRGETFTFLGLLDGDNSVTGLTISSDGTRLVAASALGALLKSDDGGAHWTRITPTAMPPLVASYFLTMAIDPTNRDILYAGMQGGGVFKSVNGGATWTQLMAGPAGPLEYSIVIDPEDPDHLLLAGNPLLESRDAGATWTIVYGAPGPVAAFDPQDSNRIYIGSIHNAVFRTTDGGVQWELFNTDNGLTCGWFNRLQVDPRNSQHLIGGGDEGICTSVDGGTTWVPASAGIFAARVETLRTAPGSQRRILLGLSPGSAYVSSDGEGTWTRIDRQQFRSGGAPSGIQVVAFNPAAPDSQWLIGLRTGGVRITQDNGATWRINDVDTPFYDLIADVALPDTFFGATVYGIYRSTNGGVNWESMTVPAGFRDFAALAADPANPAVLYAGAGKYRNPAAGVAKSVDGGRTWVASNTGVSNQAINRLVVSPTNSNTIYAAGTGGLSRSVDSGQSWTALTGLAPNYSTEIDDIAIDPSNPDIIYAAHRVLERSVDGGASWQVIYSGARQTARRVALDTLDPSIVYVGTQVHGVHEMQIAPDLRLTATPSTTDVIEGTSAHVTYELRNYGPFAASLVSLMGTFSQPAASTSIESDHGTCTRSDGTFSCSIGALASGSIATVRFGFTPSVGSFAVNAQARAHERDLVNDNNAAQVSVNVVSAPSPPSTPNPPSPPPPSQPNPPTPSPPSDGGFRSGGGGGGGAAGLFELFALLLLAGVARRSPRVC